MSSLSLNLNNGISSIFDFTHNSGLSEDANTIEWQLSDVKSNIKGENISIGKSFSEIQEELDSISSEASDENWDGYGAAPAIPESYLEAQKFINSYPMSFPLPEVTIDPDGEFAFEWYRDNEHYFSISFSAESYLIYAGIFGINKANGKEYFEDEIPKVILENIKRVYS